MGRARLVGAHKDLEKAIRKARRGGWNVGVDGNNHVKFEGPDGEVVRTALSTNGHAVKRYILHLRKNGVPC